MHLRSVGVVLPLCLLAPSMTACSTPGETVGLAGGLIAYGGQAPTSEIEQIYYLGVFDPLEQVPDTVYRVRVRGQASLLSKMQFASGWVPAPLIDSLGSRLTLDVETGEVTFARDDDSLAAIGADRNLMLMGPEGFRKAPKDHRLVLVMGSDPSEFFEGIDRAIGAVSNAQADSYSLALSKLLFEANRQGVRDLERVEDLRKALDEAAPAPSTASSSTSRSS